MPPAEPSPRGSSSAPAAPAAPEVSSGASPAASPEASGGSRGGAPRVPPRVSAELGPSGGPGAAPAPSVALGSGRAAAAGGGLQPGPGPGRAEHLEQRPSLPGPQGLESRGGRFAPGLGPGRAEHAGGGAGGAPPEAEDAAASQRLPRGSLGDAAAHSLEAWARGLAEPQGMARVAQDQFKTIGRLQDAAAVIQHFNDFSQRTFEAVGDDLAQSAHTLLGLKGDLEHIFKRVRTIKGKLKQAFPEEFRQTEPPATVEEDD